MNVLFKRAKTGKIVYYKIWTEEGTIFKETGQLNTDKPILHKEDCKSKNVGKANETTAEQQATSQALSDYKKKQDEGYKSLEDLNIAVQKFYYPGELQKLLDMTLPEFNTSADGSCKPMLATDWNKVKDISYPVYVQPKLDGVRCLVIVSTKGVTKSVRFLSRSGKDYDLPHLLVQDWPKGDYVMDGEIYSDELSFQEIVAATKKVREETSKLHFRCYDIINDKSQDQRLLQIEEFVKNMDSDYVHGVPHKLVNNMADVLSYHHEQVALGYEGCMIRLRGGKYGQGQRSRELLKVKEFDEKEFNFLRFEKGLRDEDLIAVCETSRKKEFKAKMIGTITQKQDLCEEESRLVGCPLTVKFFGYTDEGSIRFPIGKAFRDY